MTRLCLRLAALAAVVAWSRGAAGQVIIAHRGASYDAPENTLAAFRLAMEQGADGFETDFHLSADGRLACLHDADARRVAGADLVVKQTPWDELRQLDVGAWKDARWRGERMPAIEEVLAAVPPGKLVYLELKVGPESVEPLVAGLDAAGFDPRQAVVISFNAETIAEVERRRPELKTLWLARYEQDKASGRWNPSVDEVAATLQRIGADGLGSQAQPEHVDAKFVAALRAAGKFDFQVWTVDDPAVARQYLQLGATGITTNRPGWLRRQLEARPAPAPRRPVPAAAGTER